MSQVAEAGAALIIFHNNVIDGNVAGAVNAAIGAISTIKELALHTPALSQVALVMNVIDFGQKYQRGEISAASYINLTSSAVATVATFMTVGGVSAIAGIPVAGVLLGATLVGAAAELFPDEVNNIVGAAQNAFNKVATGAALEDAIDGIGDWFLPRALGLGKGPKAISPALGTTPDPIVDGVVYRVMMWADPLVLDLDGDGYEITAISPGVHFDSDGDGLKNKMAWVGADDGLLVLDRNGNGLIDSGRELFGDDTILENGTTAVNGFAALSDLDTSHDGKFDIADEKFLDVRVWKDVNQDGISQDGELFTLSAVGVKSISLSNQQSSESHGDAILNFEGSYERTNGTQGGVGCFIFAQDRFDRVFNPIEISTDAATVLDIKGTGYVRDLQEAATLNPKLIQLFNSVKNAESRADYKAKLSELILEWGLSSEYINASNNALAAGFGLVLSGPEDEQELGWMDVAIKASKTDREAFRSGLSAADQNKFDAMRDRMVGKLESTYAYEAFTAFPFFTWDKILRDATEEDPLMSGGGGQNGNPVETQMPFSQLLRERPIGTFVGVPAGYVLVNIPSPPNNVSNYYDLLWNRLLDDAARNLMPSLRLSGYVNLVDSTLSDHGLNYSFNRLDARLQEITALDKYEGTALALDLFEHFGIAFTELGWLGRETISTLAHQIGNDEAIRRAFIDVGFSFSLGTASSSMAEKFVYIGSSQDNYFSAVGSGADFVYGEAGNDTFYTEAGNDIANGGGGDDYLNSGDGDDILEGGLGDDYLSGGLGSDIYVFGRGDGQDCIYDNGESGSQIDVIKFLPGVNSQDAFIYRDETSLYIAFSNSVDKITISGFFSDKNSQVEAVEFSDGTYWGSNYLQNASYLGAEGSDILSGSNQSEKFYGKDGADSIYAYGGDDTIFGGSGDDSLSGDVGNDTYIFGIGDGQDVIDDSEGDADTIIFGEGINPDRTRIWRDISNLYIGMSDTPDFLSIQSWFDSADHRIEHINFANGTSLDASSFQLAHFIGSADIDNLNGSSGDDYLEGVGGNDVLSGGEGNDSLDGGSGDDYISGDAGNDTYLFDMGAGFDTVFDSAGTDVIQLGEDVRPSDVSIWRDLNNLYIGLNSFNDVLTINGWFDATTNRVESIKFADGTIWAASVLQAAAFGGTLGDDYVYGTTANDKVLGFSGNDYLFGDLGSDTLDGGNGNDTLSGDAGNDVYLFGMGDGQDVISEASGSADIIRFKLGVTPLDVLVSRDTNNLYFTVISSGDKIAVENHFIDTAARIERVDFADGSSWDLAAINAKMSTASNGADFLWGSAANDTLNGLDGNDQLIGNEGNDSLLGGAGSDTLDGGAGDDSLVGGTGDDTYIVDATTDVITESLNEGSDTVNSSVTFTLGANLENLTLTGSAAINGTGNTLSNVLIGNDQANQLLGDIGNDTLIGGAGNDTLNGGAGSDRLVGGSGNDTYVLDVATDTVEELAAEGTDTIQAGFTYTLGDNFENLTLTGSAAINGTGNILNNTITGNSGANLLTGFGGNDALNGGAGADTMLGGIGNDTYTVDNVGDVVTEYLNEGTDKVNSSITYTLGSNLENLTLTGSGTINGTGNEYNNAVTGNTGNNVLTGLAGNDTLDGGTGTDTLVGGIGDDIYIVDNTADVVTENLNEGVDTVKASATFTLSANIETLILTGTTAIDGTGNSLNNSLTGNDYNNILIGGAGADTMTGAFGDDTYVVDDAGDTIVEIASGGTDTVQSGINYTLGNELENLTLTGSIATTATGNGLNNTIIGNTLANVMLGGAGNDTLKGGAGNDTLQGEAGADNLQGEAGNDTLDGGAGNDVLTGGAGNDTYVLGRGYGAETVTDNDTTAGNTDVASFMAGIATDQIWFRKVNTNDLEVSVIGTSDKLTLKSWYLGNQYHLEQFKTADGKLLLDSDVQKLVDAMAAFAPPAAGQTTLPSNYQSSLNPVLAANWH